MSSAEALSASVHGDENSLPSQAEFLGVYSPDGRFTTRLRMASAGLRESTREGLRPAEVPASINLHPLETIVEDYEPPAYAIRAAKGRSLLAMLRDSLVTFAYGRERVLQAPTHVTTDSRERLIISDPDLPAVHVLDISGRKSFRIAGGPQHRLLLPRGVAVDTNDNIYVADGKRGLIGVYDPQGSFLRYIGSFNGESMFQSPAGIAIDRKAGYLYVVDPPANQLVMLDLEGRVVRRVGNKHNPATRAGADRPTEIALGEDQVLVLDSGGSRIQVFDRQCNFLSAFLTRSANDPPLASEMGLAVDSSGIYLSNAAGSTVRIYSHDGRLRGVLGNRGGGSNDLNVPSGMWIDSLGRLFIADTGNSRVLVYRLFPQPGRTQSASVGLKDAGR